MNRRHHALLAPLFAVLALLFALTGNASAAFNPAAQNPHYGEFLLQQSEVSASEWLQPADPIKENGEWIYDGALGVPVYVKQNPWSAFDPDGLAANPKFDADAAAKEAERLSKNLDGQVGSQSGPNKTWPVDSMGNKLSADKVTDCIMYSARVIAEGYRKGGSPKVAKKILTYADGEKLGNYLQSIGWSAIYFNPDMKDAVHGIGHEKRLESIQWNADNVSKGGFYQKGEKGKQLAIQGSITDFSLWKDGSSLRSGALAKMGDLKFGFLATSFGSHTALIVNGGVSEVHYDQGNTPRLYQTGTGLKSWVDHNKGGFYSGVTGTIMTPPSQAMPQQMIDDRKTMQRGEPSGSLR